MKYLISGPCSISDLDNCVIIAEELLRISKKHNLEVIFKGSIEKANRTNIDSFTTIGRDKALDILKHIKDTYGFKITTDIHETSDLTDKFLSIVDWIQIPAFLCRQTNLILAASKTGKIVTIKKGQFMSPEAMKYAENKVLSTPLGLKPFIIERGTTFGYSNLVVDVTSIKRMKDLGMNVIMDCTHSVQITNSPEGVTGGRSAFIETMAKYATIMEADGLFIEVYPNPNESFSDSGSILKLDKLEPIINNIVRISNLL